MSPHSALTVVSFDGTRAVPITGRNAHRVALRPVDGRRSSDFVYLTLGGMTDGEAEAFARRLEDALEVGAPATLRSPYSEMP